MMQTDLQISDLYQVSFVGYAGFKFETFLYIQMEIGARLGPSFKMYGKTEILSVQISETKHAIQLKFSSWSLPNEY